MSDRDRLHGLVDRLPADELRAALRYLSYLCSDPMLVSMLNAPPDDEPYTDQQRVEDAEAEASIARGEGVSHDEILREFGLRS
jgi:hypothetical protein